MYEEHDFISHIEKKKIRGKLRPYMRKSKERQVTWVQRVRRNKVTSKYEHSLAHPFLQKLKEEKGKTVEKTYVNLT